jgi:putative oxidoreductase
MKSVQTRLTAIFAQLGRFPMSLLQLAMRLGIAAMFFRSGLIKIRSWEFAVLLFRDEYQVPFLEPVTAARIATAVELGLPVFLVLGLGTRIAALPLLGMVAVIQFLVYPNAWSDHLIWASILLLLATRGPGNISVDYLFVRYVTANHRLSNG